MRGFQPKMQQAQPAKTLGAMPQAIPTAQQATIDSYGRQQGMAQTMRQAQDRAGISLSGGMVNGLASDFTTMQQQDARTGVAAKRVSGMYLADGGVVGGIKRMLGMGNDSKKQPVGQPVQSMEPAKPAQAPASKPQSAISDYSGMSATERRMKAQGLADGGPIVGPGTGTSDSIPDAMPPGTFIMPADSTQAIGMDKLQQMASTPAPADVDKELAHAVGVALLTAMRDQTHAFVGGEKPEMEDDDEGDDEDDLDDMGEGYKSGPTQFFNRGGVVKDQEYLDQLANQTQMYVTGAQAAANERGPVEPVARMEPAGDPQQGLAATGFFPNVTRQMQRAPAAAAPSPAPKPANEVPATQVEGWRTKAVMDGASQDAQASWDRGGLEGVAGAAGAVARGAIAAIPTAIGEFGANTLAPLYAGGKAFVKGLTGEAGPGAQAAQPQAQPPVQPQAQQPRTDVQRGGGNVPAVAAAPAQPQAQPANDGYEANPRGFTPGGQVIRKVMGPNGVPLYSNMDDASNAQLLNRRPRSAQNEAAVQGVFAAAERENMQRAAANQYRQEVMDAARSNQAAAIEANRQQAPLNLTDLRNPVNLAMRNASVDLMPSTRGFVSGGRGGAGGGSGGGASAEAQVAANRIGDLSKLQVQQVGNANADAASAQQQIVANERQEVVDAAARQQYADQQTAQQRKDLVEQQRYDQGRTDNAQTRALEQQKAQITAEIINPATPEARRNELLKVLNTASGSNADKYAYAPGGQIVDPVTNQLITQPGVIFNTRTGQRADQGLGGQTLPPGMKRYLGTSNGRPVYEDMNGKQVIAKG